MPWNDGCWNESLPLNVFISKPHKQQPWCCSSELASTSRWISVATSRLLFPFFLISSHLPLSSGADVEVHLTDKQHLSSRLWKVYSSFFTVTLNVSLSRFIPTIMSRTLLSFLQSQRWQPWLVLSTKLEPNILQRLGDETCYFLVTRLFELWTA